jgi:hypothetical protein
MSDPDLTTLLGKHAVMKECEHTKDEIMGTGKCCTDIPWGFECVGEGTDHVCESKDCDTLYLLVEDCPGEVLDLPATLTRLVAIADAAAQFSTEHDAGWGHWPMFAALRQALERSEG